MRILFAAIIGATTAAVVAIFVLEQFDIEGAGGIAGGIGGAVGASVTASRGRKKG